MSASIRGTSVLAGVTALCLAAACGDAQQPPASAPAAKSPALVIEKGRVKIPKPFAGDPSQLSSELPASFPADVPRHPFALVVQSRASADQGLAVSLLIPDEKDATQIASFYSDNFAAEGWATDVKRSPEGHTIFADKGKRAASAVVRSGDRGTVVDLIVIEVPMPAGG